MLGDKIRQFLLANAVVILLAVAGVLGVMYLWQQVKGWGLKGKLEKVEAQNENFQLQLSNLALANRTMQEALVRQSKSIEESAALSSKWRKEIAGDLREGRAVAVEAGNRAQSALNRPFSGANSCDIAESEAKAFLKGNLR